MNAVKKTTKCKQATINVYSVKTWFEHDPDNDPSRVPKGRGFRGVPVKIAITTVLRDRPALTRGMVIATPRARNLRGLAQAREQLRRAGYSDAEVGLVAFCAAPGDVRYYMPTSDPGVGESLIERHRKDWL